MGDLQLYASKMLFSTNFRQLSLQLSERSKNV